MEPKDSKKAGYSVLLFGAYARTTVRDLQSHGGNPLVHWGELQHSSAQLGTSEYPQTRLAPHTLGNSGNGEGPAPLQEFGSRTGAVCGGEPNHI